MPALAAMSGLPKFLNPKIMPLARKMPPLAVLTHQGRKSGRQFHTPVQAYRTKTGFTVGLAYTSKANWAQNLLASGTGEITRGGHTYLITAPTRRGAEALKDLPVPVALMMRALHITDFMQFDAQPKP